MTVAYRVVMISEKSPIPSETISAAMNRFKDWLKFGHTWLVYTACSNEEVRDHLKQELSAYDPGIIVMTVTKSEWAAYSREMPRQWLKKVREEPIEGD